MAELPETVMPKGPLYCFVVDDGTIGDAEHPILVVNLSRFEDDATSFRVIPEAMAMVEMNLSIANVSFSDYPQDEPERYSGIGRPADQAERRQPAHAL